MIVNKDEEKIEKEIVVESLIKQAQEEVEVKVKKTRTKKAPSKKKVTKEKLDRYFIFK